jgi:hypothetical protein
VSPLVLHPLSGSAQPQAPFDDTLQSGGESESNAIVGYGFLALTRELEFAGAIAVGWRKVGVQTDRFGVIVYSVLALVLSANAMPRL